MLMNVRSLFFNDSINFKFLYDVPYIKQIIAFFLIPLLVFIIICSIILLAYSNKGVNNIKYKYKANVFSIIISILLTVVFLSILLGFSYAFYKQMTAVGLKTPLAYLVIASPIIPFIFLISFFIKLIKVIKKKPPKEIDSLEESKIKEESLKENVDDIEDEPVAPITEEEVVDAFKEIPNIPEEPKITEDIIEEQEDDKIMEDIIEDDIKIEEQPFGKHEESGKHEKIEHGKHESEEIDSLDDIISLNPIEEETKQDEEIELL